MITFLGCSLIDLMIRIIGVNLAKSLKNNIKEMEKSL